MNINSGSNLDEKINLIYNFIYNKIDNSCFKISKINVKNIKINDVKIGLEYRDINKETFKGLKKGNFQLINHDTKTMITFLKRFSDNFTIDIIIQPFLSGVKQESLLENRDALFSYLLSELVLNKKTTGIRLPIINFDVKFDHIEELLRTFNLYNYYNDLKNNDIIGEVFSLRIKENFQNGITLDKLLDEKQVNYKHLFFQLIHILATIQKEYPTFVHNSLTIRNIFVYISTEKGNKKFKFDNNFYELLDTDLEIKLFNFHSAETKEFPKSKKFNSYFDLYTFFKSLYKMTSFSDCDSETLEFLERVFLKEYKKKTEIKELFKPSKLLKDEYFQPLVINKTEKKSSQQKYMKNYSKNKYNRILDNDNIFITNLESDTRSLLGHQTALDSEKKYKRNEVNKKSSKRLVRKLKKSNQVGGYNVKPIEEVDDQKVLDQEGGSFRQQSAPYKTVKNNPFLSNDAKDTFNKRKEEKPMPKEPAILAEQKVYERPEKSQGPVLPQVYPPAHIPVPNPYYPHTNPQYAYGYKPNQIPVQKYYNITLSNPVGNHTTINRVLEDMLPGDDRVYTLQSTFERKQLTNYLRSLILDDRDGEELSISPGNKRTLLSYIRLLELNPYNINSNPYLSLSKGFLLYNSAYPIRYDQDKNNLSVAKKALGVNVRIYELSEGAIRSKELNDSIDSYNFDVWREMQYYNYVREEIIKKKVCPNFTGIYLYTIDSTSRIDYSKLDLIKYKNQPKEALEKEIKNIKKINDLHHIDPLQFLILNSYGMQKKTLPGKGKEIFEVSEESGRNIAKYLNKNKYMILTPGTRNQYTWTKVGLKFLDERGFYRLVDETNRPIEGKKVTSGEIKLLANIIGKQDLTESSSKSLIALTEAPNSNILKWASPLSESFGAVKKMIETGYHTPDIWRSILFQMVYTCAVLQEKHILFSKFSLENNFFIKDLYSNPEKRGHWIYKVGEFDFYVPNYGYLLMFDSKYADIVEYEGNPVYNTDRDSTGRQYKINSDILFKNSQNENKNNFTDSNNGVIYENIILNDFKRLINPDNFNINLEKIGGEQPDQDILRLLRRMFNEGGFRNIRDYLGRFFPEMMNNRIGTLLNKEEKENLTVIRDLNFKVGELVAYDEGYDQYKWVIIIQLNVGSRGRLVKIIDSAGGASRDVGPFRLYKYPQNETIKQNTNNGVNYDSNFTIETYNIDN